MGPEVVHEQFGKLLNAGNLEGLCALYEPGAVMIERDGTLLKSVPAIRAHLAGLLSIKPTLTIQRVHTIGTDDVAVLVSTWVIAGTGRQSDRGQRPDVRYHATAPRRHMAGRRGQSLGEGPVGGCPKGLTRDT